MPVVKSSVAEVLAVCDLVGERAETTAKKFDVPNVLRPSMNCWR